MADSVARVARAVRWTRRPGGPDGGGLVAVDLAAASADGGGGLADPAAVDLAAVALAVDAAAPAVAAWRWISADAAVIGDGDRQRRTPGDISAFGNRVNRGRGQWRGMLSYTFVNSALDAKNYSLNGQSQLKPAFASNRISATGGGALVIPHIINSPTTIHHHQLQRHVGPAGLHAEPHGPDGARTHRRFLADLRARIAGADFRSRRPALPSPAMSFRRAGSRRRPRDC